MLGSGYRRFRYCLAERIGKTVAEIDETVSRQEMIGWMAYISMLSDERQMSDHQRGALKCR